MFNVTYEFLKRRKKLTLGHQIEDMIISCVFNGSPMLNTTNCLEYFVPLYDPHLGNCYSFSSGDGKRPIPSVTEPDAWQDLQDMDLMLNAEYDEYLNPTDKTAGLIITMHEDMTLPHVFGNGMHIYADHSYNLAVLKNSVFLLPFPFETNCTDFSKLPFNSFFDDMELSPRLCSVGCLMYLQEHKCPHSYVTDNVVLFADVLPYNPDEIDHEDKECASDIAENYHEYCNTLCSVPCHDIHYGTTMDSSPTSDHKIVVTGNALNDYRKRRGEKKEVFVTDVRIYYQSMEHRIYQHSPEFTTETLFSYLGGISGGWLGISLLEFCAFVEGLLSVLVFSFSSCKPQKRERKRKKASPTPPSKVMPVCHGKCQHSGVILGFPVARSGRSVRVYPYGYY